MNPPLTVIDNRVDSLLQQVTRDIRDLPAPALQLVGALISIHEGLPKVVHDFIMEQLSRRTDMSEVSPAAEALMKVAVLAVHPDHAYAQAEIQMHWQLLKAVGLESAAIIALAFLVRLKIHLLETVKADYCV